MKNYKSIDTIPALHRNIDGTDEYYFTDQEKANCLNEYFTSVSNLDDSIINLPTFDCNVNPFWTKFKLEMNKLKKSLKSLMKKKAVDPDLISHKVLKGVKHTISKPLSLLFNKSLRKGISLSH